MFSNSRQYIFLNKHIRGRILLTSNIYQGDSKRDFNPTCYRSDTQYSHMVSSVQVEGPEGGQKFGFEMVLKKKVKTYIEVQSFNLSLLKV